LFQSSSNLRGNNFRGREVGGFFEVFIYQAEDFQAQFVAFDQFIVAEGFESLGLFAGNAIFLFVAGTKSSRSPR
jgi:hypothetical protein